MPRALHLHFRLGPWLTRLNGWVRGHPWETLALAVALLGTLMRIVRWAANRSLWIDEAFLAASIVNRDWPQLLRPPLEYDQSAPAGFLALAKAATTLLGDTELALRLPSLVAGVLLLPLMWALARRWLTPPVAVLALALVALSEPLVYFSAEAKQYALETTVGAALLLVGVWRWDSRDWATHAELMGIGALAVFCSHSAVFVLAGIVAARGLRDLWRHEWQGALRTACLAGVWAGTFTVSYWIYIHAKAESEGDWDFWAAGYAPWPTSLSAVTWYPNQLCYVVDTSLHVSSLTLAGVLVVLGLVHWSGGHSRRWDALALIGGLGLAVLAASVLRKYPVLGRMALFVAPSLALLIAGGVSLIVGSLDLRRRLAAAIVIGTALMYGPLTTAFDHLAHPPGREEVRDALQHVARHARPGEALFLGWSSRPAYEFYVPRHIALNLPTRVGANPQHRLSESLWQAWEWAEQRRADSPSTQSATGVQRVRIWVLLSFQSPVPNPDKLRPPGQPKLLERVRLPGVSLELWEF